MTEIKYKNLDAFTGQIKKGEKPGVFLIFGEEALYKKALKKITKILVSGQDADLCHEEMDGDMVHDAIAALNTFSLFGGPKIITLADSRIFYSKQDKSSVLKKAWEKWKAGEKKKAAKYISSFLGLMNLGLDDVDGPEKRKANFKGDNEIIGNGQWIDDLISYCADNNILPSAPPDAASDLEKAISKGFAPESYLIITTDMVDKRKKLYKTIKEKEIIIDCSVAKGNIKAAKMARESVLSDEMKAVLSPLGKVMDGLAFKTLCELTGFDLRTFSSGLEKLASYVGERKKITAEDVKALIRKTRQEPVYELSNAIALKNAPDCIYYINSLISDGFFPLQILAAMINQIRRLILARGFIESSYGKKSWRPGISFDIFKKSVMPLVKEFDKIVTNQAEKWKEAVLPCSDKKTKKKKKTPSSTDLILAKNPQSPYPVYLLIHRAGRFTTPQLSNALEILKQADKNLKTTGSSPRLILEKAVIEICKDF